MTKIYPIMKPHQPLVSMPKPYIFSNIDVAILHKFNQLAHQYGLKASDITVLLGDGESYSWLKATNAATDPVKARAIAKMLDSIGFKNYELHVNTYADIEDALDSALRRAPARMPWSRT